MLELPRIIDTGFFSRLPEPVIIAPQESSNVTPETAMEAAPVAAVEDVGVEVEEVRRAFLGQILFY